MPLPKPDGYSKKWMTKEIVGCSHCKMRCCDAPNRNAFIKVSEAERDAIKKNRGIDVPEGGFQSTGRCQYLGPGNTGCTLGDDRPAYCKLWPVVVSKTNKLEFSSVGFMYYCPKPTDYDFVGEVDGKYHYKLKKGKGKNMKHEDLVLDKPMSEVAQPLYKHTHWPAWIKSAFGEEFYESMARDIEQPDTTGTIESLFK